MIMITTLNMLNSKYRSLRDNYHVFCDTVWEEHVGCLVVTTRQYAFLFIVIPILVLVGRERENTKYGELCSSSKSIWQSVT